MKRSEIKRLQVIEKVIKRELTQIEAGSVLGLSSRQVRRLVKRVKEFGERGLIHGLRSRPSHNRISERIRQNILKVYKAKYQGFGPTLASEMLEDYNGIKISKETLRKWLIREALWQVKKNCGGRHLRWRERKPHCGEMIQVDGSHHDWLEGRGPRLVLMAWIDDATNRTFARFYDHEGTVPALDSLKRYISKYGIPSSVYSDRHSTYKSWAKETVEDQLNDRIHKSHFELACEKLGIEVIHAYSPQAKGRVERLFKTLQDRLVKELRLAQAKTLEDANTVLGRFFVKHNARFNVPAKESGDMHRPWRPELDAEDVFSIQRPRTLRNDNTILDEGQYYQILSRTTAKQVIIRQTLAGRMEILGNGVRLKYEQIPARPVRLRRSLRARQPFCRPKLSPKNPWTRFTLNNQKSGHSCFA